MRQKSLGGLTTPCEKLPVRRSFITVELFSLDRGDDRATIVQHISTSTSMPGQVKKQPVTGVELTETDWATRSVDVRAKHPLEAMLLVPLVHQCSGTGEHGMAIETQVLAATRLGFLKLKPRVRVPRSLRAEGLPRIF